ERQRGRGAGQHDRNAAGLRDELEGDRDDGPDARVRDESAVSLAAAMKRASVFLTAAFALAGCVIPPAEPDYAATWPEPAPSETQGNGAIYQAGHDVALFENSVARRVGDTLTIRLNENTNASKSSSTTTKKSTSADMPGPIIAGRPVTVNGTEVLNMSVDNKTAFDGEGGSSQSNRLQGDIS